MATRALPVALTRDVLLVGRRAEAAWLDDLLARAGNGPVGALVRGEPGAGRTTLVTSFGRRAFQQGCAVLYGATSTGRVSTLQPVRDAMTALDECVGSDRRGDAFDDDIDGFSAGMRDAVGDAARATGKPVVVIVDDLDRADPETVDVLRGLLSAVEPVAVMLIATTTVPSGAHDAAEPWWTAERSLAPFTEDEVAELLEFRLGTPPMPELAAAVRDEADGNARRVEKLAARLAEAELDQRVERAIARAESVQHDLRLVQGEIATSIAERAHRSRFGRDDGQPDEPAGTERAHACPYKGLASFEAEDEAFFCGRDRQIDDLVARLAVTRFVAVVGPSGSGKSSLVRAGLVPALRRGALPGSAEWETVIVAPGDSTAVERVVVRGPPKHGSRSRVTVIVDHLEELFTGGGDEEVQVDFLGTLARAATTPGGSATVVVAFRGDFYDRFAAFPAFARLLAESQLLVGPMTDDEVHAAIEEPARRAALTLEPGLADAIAADVAGQPGALPLLSTALLQTWVRRRGNVLTHAGYHDTGGVGGAVARLAEDTYLQFTPDEQRACRLLMLRLAEPGEGSDDVRRRVPLAELGETGETEVLQTLVARRLVTTGDGTAEVTHEALLREWPRLARWLEEDRDGRRLHHRVAAAAVEWNTADRDPAELYRGTRLEAALDWSAAHPGEANPLEREFLDAGGAAQDHDLRTARRTARRLRSLATGLAVLLVVAVVAGALALTQRSDANRQATRANKAATLARATQLGTLARTLPANQNDLALLLGVEGRRLQPSITTDGGLEAALVHRPPELERVIHFDTPVAYPTLSDDGRLIAAPGNDGSVRIYDFVTGRLVRTLRGTGEPAFVSFFNADASLVVTGGIHGKVTIWRVATGKPIGPPIDAGGAVVYGSFDADATQVSVVSDNGTIGEWDFHDPKHPTRVGEPTTIPHVSGEVPVVACCGGPDKAWTAVGGTVSNRSTIRDGTHRAVQEVDGVPGGFSPDGSILATASGDRVELWDPVSGARRGELIADSHPIEPSSPTFSPDGRLLAASDADDSAIRVFDVVSGRLVAGPLALHSAFGMPGRFLPGDRLVTFGADEAAVWHLDTRVPPLETDLRGHTGGPPNTENGAWGQFTPDGTETVTVGVGDKRVLGYDAATGKPRGDLIGGHIVTEFRVAFSPDAKIIAAGSLDGFTLWDRASGRQLSHVRTAGNSSTTVAWDPHRPLLATSDPSNSIRFWDVSDPRRPVARRTLRAPGGSVWFSPDGRLLATADEFTTYTATVFDVATGKKLQTIGGGTGLSEVTFTPDSRTLAAGISELNGGKVVLYDTRTWHSRTLVLPYAANGLAFVDGGARFVTSTYMIGGRVDLWDTATLQPVGESLTISTADSYSAAADPRGTKVVFGSFQGVTPVLDVDPHSWERTACRVVGRNLTRAQWARYLPGQAYRKTCPQWRAGP